MEYHISCSTYLILYLVFNFIGYSALQSAFGRASDYICPRRTVELIVSPLQTLSEINLLQLTWTTLEDVAPGDYVALYEEDPNNPESRPLFSIPVLSKEGWITTQLQQNTTNYETLAFSSQCIGYWIAYKNNKTNKVLASSCLKTEPRWMETYRSDVENLTLQDMFIPGTHNSGSFKVVKEPSYETIFQKYLFTQDESILNQLIYGVRYLDLRVSYYPETEEVWWLNHDVFKVRPLQPVLDDIMLFVNKTREIVIIDLHDFPVGFTTNSTHVHGQLRDYLKSYLGNQLVPVLPEGWLSTLKSVLDTSRQIILSYNKFVFGRKKIWPSVHQKWGNVQSLDGLKLYLDKTFDSVPSYPWAAMAELTPAFLDVVTNRLGGLRKMADIVNKNVSRWFQSEHYGSSCNIVAVDFFKSTGIIQAAINWNRKKGLDVQC